MRWIPVFFALSVSLSAADPDVLAQAVADFSHDDRMVREAASRRVDAHLRRVLAPLLAGLDAEDVEVRRRCRAAILGLVPHTLRSREEEEDRARAAALGALRRRPAILFRQAQRPAGAELRDLRAFGVVAQVARTGLAVSDVFHGRIAEELGVRPGDILLRVNGDAVNGFGDLVTALGDEAGQWRKAKIRVLRGAEVLDLPQR